MPRPLGEILADKLFPDVREIKAASDQPKPEIPSEAQIAMAGHQAVAALLKPLDKKMDVLAERAFAQAPHHPARVQISCGDHRRSSAHGMCVGS